MAEDARGRHSHCRAATRASGLEDGRTVSASVAHLLTGRSEGTRYSFRTGTGKAAGPRRQRTRIRAGNWSRGGHDRTYKRVQSSPNRSKLERERGSNYAVFSSLSTLMRTLAN